MFRRGLAIVLSVMLSAAALVLAPSATAGDGEAAKDRDPCEKASSVKIKVTPDGSDQFDAVGIVWSSDSDTWSWRFRHNDDISAKGQATADGDGEGRSFTIQRSMVNLSGNDYFAFRAENDHTGEVCRVDVYAG